MTAGDGLRASDADRRRATEVLDTALREARLDAREHDERSQAVTATGRRPRSGPPGTGSSTRCSG